MKYQKSKPVVDSHCQHLYPNSFENEQFIWLTCSILSGLHACVICRNTTFNTNYFQQM